MAANEADLLRFPGELRERPQWVAWKYVGRGGKPTKVPVEPKTGFNASSTDPDSWGTFGDAVDRVKKDGLAGVGFVFSEEDPYVGVDLDDVLNPETGEVEGWAVEVIEKLGSYSEFSPSGTGLHVFVEGEVPKGGPNTLPNGHTVEVYDRARFFTVTGRRLDGTPGSVEDRREVLDELLPAEDANGPRSAPVPDKLTEGSREPLLFSLAGTLFRRGLTVEEMLPTLLAVNAARCEPPHGEEYVRGIADKIFERGYEAGSPTAGVTGADSTDGTDSARGQTPAAVASLPPAVPFPVDALPDIPRRLVEEGAASTGTSPDMFAALVLSALGGAVGTSRRLVLKRNWKEYPAVWTCVVSSSGDKKTPAFRIAMAPAYAEQGRLVKDWRGRMEGHKRELAEWQERKKAAKGKGGGEDPGPKPEEPELEHVFVQDVTVEELGVILSKTPRGVSALWDELSGFFSGMDQYKSGGKGNERTKYLSMWNGGPPLKVDRRGEGFVWAERPLVSVTGTIQPSVLPALSRRHAGVVGGDDGMAHRFLFSYPEPPVILSDLTDYDVSPLTDTYYGFLYESLRRLEPDEEGNPVEVRFTEEGEAAFRRHNEGFRRRMYLPGVTEAYKSAVAKLASSQLARVSLLLCLVRSAVGDGEEEAVTGEDVQRAAKIIDYFVAHARRVHAVLFPETGEQRLLRVLTGLVFERGTEDAPGSGVRRLKMPAEDFRLALREGGVHDASEPNQLTKDLQALAEEEPRLEVQRRHLGKGRALDVVLLPPDTPGGTVGGVGGVGDRNTPGEGVLLRRGAELVLFVLRQRGPLFPVEIAELTGKTHGAVKKIISELRTAGEVRDTGKTDEHGSRQVAWVEPRVEGDAGEAAPSYPAAVQRHMPGHAPEDLAIGTGEEPVGYQNDQRLLADPDDAALWSRPILLAPADLPALLERVAATEVVALDLETTGLDPRRHEARLLTLATERGAWVVDLSVTHPAPILEALKGRTNVIHNAAFDLAFLSRLGYEHEGELVDTMLLSQLLHAGANVPPLRRGRTSHALDSVVRRELGVELDKTQQISDWGGELTPEMIEYAARDAEVLFPLHRQLTKKIEEAGLNRASEIEQSAQRGILWMARSGLPFDEARWLRLAEEASREAARLNIRLQEMAPPHPEGKEWNWNSNQQVRQALSMLGLPVEDTRDETLARLDHPFARSLREYRKWNGIAARHGEKWLRAKDGTGRVMDGRVYPAWRQIGAATGRMACADPNLQAIPHGSGHHSCVKAPEGRVLVKADYSQIELRLAAKMWNEPVMLGTFRDGGDVHTTTARSITGKEEITKQERKLAKAVNFGLIFGQGARGLKDYAQTNYGVEMTLEEAGAYRRRFFETYKGVARWHASDGALLSRGRFETRTLAGRRRQDVRSYTEHLNAPVQGTAADGMKMALALLWERRHECPGAVPILAVHDEIVVECDADKAAEAKEWLVRAMKDGMDAVVNGDEPRVPIEVEASVSEEWGD